MTLLEEVNTIVGSVGLPVETGVFSGAAPVSYVVVTPMTEQFALFADNAPGMNISEARLSLYIKTNYEALANQLVRALLAADFTITGRQYVGREDDTGYFHFAIDVAKEYVEEES